MIQKLTIDKKAKTMTIVMDLESPHPSKSGKTMTLASTGGFKAVEEKYDGLEVQANINVFFKPAAK